MNRTKKLLGLSIFLNLILLVSVIVIFTKVSGFSYIKNMFKSGAGKEFSSFHKINSSVYEVLPKSDSEIVFLGDSLTHWGGWNELFNNVNIKNRGIPGDTSSDIMDCIDLITKNKPKKLFLMIGINDLKANTPVSDISNNYRTIIKKVSTNSPNTEIILQSVLPINNDIFRVNTTNDKITELNNKIKEISTEYRLIYIDLNQLFIDKNGQLKEELTIDGVHINGNGYLVWKDAIDDYINK